MWEGLAISILALVSVLIGYAMGKDKSRTVQYTQNIYGPDSLDATTIYRQTKDLLGGTEED